MHETVPARAHDGKVYYLKPALFGEAHGRRISS
jgi:hypothetical protein